MTTQIELPNGWRIAQDDEQGLYYYGAWVTDAPAPTEPTTATGPIATIMPDPSDPRSPKQGMYLSDARAIRDDGREQVEFTTIAEFDRLAESGSVGYVMFGFFGYPRRPVRDMAKARALVAKLLRQYERGAWGKFRAPTEPTTECAICYHVGPCTDDGEALICTDRAACRARCDAALDGYEGTQAELPRTIWVNDGRMTFDKRFCEQCKSITPHTLYSDRTFFICDDCSARDDEPEAEFYAQAPTPATMDEAVELAYARRHVPLEGEERYTRAHTPAEALRLALERGVFGTETLTILHASLEVADEEALTRAEQLAAARDSVAINLEMHKIEAAIFDLPF